ncbi:MAG: M48 family metalloprotease [Bacteriovorax sp.]
MKNVFKAFMVSALFFNAFSANAYVPVADTLLGQAIDKVLLVAGKSSIEKVKQYRAVNDPKGVARVKRIIKNIETFSGKSLRYQNPTIRIIEGVKNEPNAYSLGPAIYISEETLSILDNGELTAVLAHEIAHSEYGHLLARLVYIVGSPTIHLRDLAFSDIFYLTTGQADEYMERIIKDGHLTLVSEIIENSSVRQELQADCLAANWLEKARKKGWKLSPLDLNRATNKIMGIDLGNIDDDTLPPVIRYRAIVSGKHIGSNCSL